MSKGGVPVGRVRALGLSALCKTFSRSLAVVALPGVLEELERRNYAETTKKGYIQAVEDLARYFKRPPDRLRPAGRLFPCLPDSEFPGSWRAPL